MGRMGFRLSQVNVADEIAGHRDLLRTGQCKFLLDIMGRLTYNVGASPWWVVSGSLHRALDGGDARGFSYATMKRREVVDLLNRCHSSGAADFRALLSRRLLVTSRHVILKLGPYSSSVPFSVM